MRKKWYYENGTWFKLNYLTDEQVEQLHDPSLSLEERKDISFTKGTELTGDELSDAQALYDSYKPSEEPSKIVWIGLNFWNDEFKSGIVNYYNGGRKMKQKRFPKEIIY
jgi:hypothetical protein